MKQGGLDNDGSDVEGGVTGFKWIELRMVATNWRSWVLVTSLTCQAIGFYGSPSFAYTFQQILSSLLLISLQVLSSTSLP